MQQELEDMRKALVIRNYAAKTVSTYVAVLGRYLAQLDKPIKGFVEPRVTRPIFRPGSSLW